MKSIMLMGLLIALGLASTCTDKLNYLPMPK